MKTSFVVSLLFLGAASAVPMAVAQSPGTFTAAGNMTGARFLHTATLLPNGKVLIAGGISSPTAPASAIAELYDPSTGMFTPTGAMILGRCQHTATLLPDGKVLIAGGVSSLVGMVNPTATAELYDPATGTFTATGDMVAPRSAHTATLLNNGKVLITPGARNGASFAELYDPPAGKFTATDSNPFDLLKPVLLISGKVLIVSTDLEGPGGADVYDPDTGTFSPTGGTYGAYPNGVIADTATMLPDGKVLVSLQDCYEDRPAANLYDAAAGVFTTTGNLAYPSCMSTGVLLSDGAVLITGGYFVGPLGQIYDPASGTFSRTGDMTTDRHDHVATLLNDGTVLISGGAHPTGSSLDLSTYNCCVPLASAEIYHPNVSKPSAALLSLSGDGRGPGAIQHAFTYETVSSDRPATAGEALIIYCTDLIDGGAIPPRIAIGGRLAEVLWFGSTPVFPGLNQINVRVPAGVSPGPAVPVRLDYLSRPSNQVTIAVQ